MKRHASFLSDGGTGKIFRVQVGSDGGGGGISEFLDLYSLFAAGTAGDDPHPAGTAMDRDNHNDGINGDVNEAWDAVGKRGFGDLDLSDDELTLYAVNLADRSLYAIPLGSDPTHPVAPSLSTNITVTAIPNDCGDSDDARPFALGANDGTVYVGGVCTAESTQSTDDLSAYVYTYTEGAGFSATPWLSFIIDHGRGCAVVPNCAPADWLPWSPTFSTIDTNWRQRHPAAQRLHHQHRHRRQWRGADRGLRR